MLTTVLEDAGRPIHGIRTTTPDPGARFPSAHVVQYTDSRSFMTEQDELTSIETAIRVHYNERSQGRSR